jgi:hypothetical protein
MEEWNDGIRECWNNGIRECWNNGVEGFNTHHSNIPFFHPTKKV